MHERWTWGQKRRRRREKGEGDGTRAHLAWKRYLWLGSGAGGCNGEGWW
jgi:hypothetical protein